FSVPTAEPHPPPHLPLEGGGNFPSLFTPFPPEQLHDWREAARARALHSAGNFQSIRAPLAMDDRRFALPGSADGRGLHARDARNRTSQPAAPPTLSNKVIEFRSLAFSRPATRQALAAT